MKRKYLLVLLVLPALILLITSSGVSGVNEEDNTISFDENLVEGPNTTFIENQTGLKTIVQKYLFTERDITSQIKESQIIVKGKVIQILDTVVTYDLISDTKKRDAEDGWFYLHTDVLFEVDEYFGPNKLPFEQLVLRHVGGKIEGKAAHICEQEQLTVGEDVIIFRLAKPDIMVQVPEGYSLEQYYLFCPASKYVHIGEGKYKASFKNESFDMKSLRRQINN